MTYIFKDAQAVRTQISALIAHYPELEEDATLLADTVDGETDFERVAEKVFEFIRQAETLAHAIKERKDDMGERQKRYERQGESGRRILISLMKAARTEKLVLTEATISLTKPRDSVTITDLDALPQGFFRSERKALSKEILAEIKSGHPVPGAELVTGEGGIAIRTK